MNTSVSERLAEGSEPQINWAVSEFEQLYTEHSQAVYYLALRFLGDPQKAEDATHDVFLKAFRKMGQFRGESSWRTWLYRIAINHCRNLQKTWYEHHVFADPDDAVLDHAPALTDSPLRVLEIKELGQRIQAALEQLPAEYRLLLLLVADEELSYEQVGDLTGQSADAVRGKPKPPPAQIPPTRAGLRGHRMKRQNKLQHEAAQQMAAQQQTQPQTAREFATVEDMLRHDALHTPVPPAIARRLQGAIGQIPPPARGWWRRWFGG